MKQGNLFAILAYIIWGLLPLYWNLLIPVSPFEILCHRAIWSLVFVLFIFIFKKDIKKLFTGLKDKKNFLKSFLPAFFIACCWIIYIYAVNSGYIVEASLGFFINPLVSVFLGVVFMKEKMRKIQWLAILVAIGGVAIMTISYGKFPVIAIILAVCFGLYGLFRKQSTLNSLEGLSFEMIILFIPALVYLLILGFNGTISFGAAGSYTSILLMLSGIATLIPLLLFVMASRRIPLSRLGILQYISPCLLFFIGVFINKEEFGMDRFIGFCFIWTSLIIYTIDSYINHKAIKRRLKAGKVK